MQSIFYGASKKYESSNDKINKMKSVVAFHSTLNLNQRCYCDAEDFDIDINECATFLKIKGDVHIFIRSSCRWIKF